MDTFLDTETDIVIEQLAFVAAAGGAARYDETVKNLPSSETIYRPAAMRREALAIANLEGMNPRRENLARLIGNREMTGIERDTKATADIYDALVHSASIFGETVEASGLNTLFLLSDTSSGRLMRPDVIWSLEEDSHWMADQLDSLSQECNPWTAAECLRQIWTSGRFIGKARRIALIAAPWIMKQGFSCDFPLYGLAPEIRKRVNIFRDVAQNKEDWAGQLASALDEAVRVELLALKDVPVMKATLSALCPSVRSSSSIGRAIDFMLGSPAFSAKTFSEALKLTDRGAKDVLDKLVDTNVIEVEGGLRNRLFVCRRTI
jgi:hypothetical protein